MMKLKRGLLVLTVLGVFAAGAFATFLGWDWNTPYKKTPGRVTVTIVKGMKAGQVLEMMSKKGLVRSRLSFKLAFAVFGRPRKIMTGTYSFDKPESPLGIIDKLNKGEVTLTKVTIPEGLRDREIAKILADAGLGRREAFLKAMNDPSFIRPLDPRAQKLEGYLFPETYLVDPGLDEESIVHVLVDGFREWWTRTGEPSGTTLSPREIVTLASLIEKETGSPKERGLIAGVFMNRLRLGMPLQTDPTIIFAQIMDGDYKGYLTRKDLAYPSPYNTYLHGGLPPGPICNPGQASLDAVIHPTRSSYLYFVSRNDGTHAFSKTLAEHNHWVSVYQHRGGHGRNGKKAQ
jgi:UPF0755 protein